MPRFSSARGEQTHRRIVDATLRVIASEGVRAVTHRRVATEAESASPGLITYYFPTSEDLIVGALAEVAERDGQRYLALRDRVLEIGDDVPALVDVVTAEVMARSGPKKIEATAALALTLELAGQRFDREPLVAWEEAEFALARALIEAVGGESDIDMEVFVSAMIDGLYLTAVISQRLDVLESGVRRGLAELLEGIRSTSLARSGRSR